LLGRLDDLNSERFSQRMQVLIAGDDEPGARRESAGEEDVVLRIAGASFAERRWLDNQGIFFDPR